MKRTGKETKTPDTLASVSSMAGCGAARGSLCGVPIRPGSQPRRQSFPTSILLTKTTLASLFRPPNRAVRKNHHGHNHQDTRRPTVDRLRNALIREGVAGQKALQRSFRRKCSWLLGLRNNPAVHQLEMNGFFSIGGTQQLHLPCHAASPRQQYLRKMIAGFSCFWVSKLPCVIRDVFFPKVASGCNNCVGLTHTAWNQ